MPAIPNMTRAGAKYYNSHIVKPEGRCPTSFRAGTEQAGCRTRKDGAADLDTLVTASPEFFKGKSPKEIQAFFRRGRPDFLIGRVGRENIVSKKPGCQAARRGRRCGADRRDPDPPAVRSAGLSPIKISEAAPVSRRELPLRR